MKAHHRSITTNAARLREMQQQMHAAIDLHDGPAHYAACMAFHSNFDRLAFPGGLRLGMQRLRQHDPDALELAVRWLEADPQFFRSGYIKERVLHILKRAPLKADHRERLTRCILCSVLRGPRRVFAAYARLAGFMPSSELAACMKSYLDRGDPEVHRRARRVLSVLHARTTAAH